MKWIQKVALFIAIVGCMIGSLHAEQTTVQPEYQFLGRHLVVSYHGCDHKALTDVKKLSEKMREASKACGAQVLNSMDYYFPGDGLTMVCLLSESHASIHTYPEYDACFVDLFTCGTNCSAEKFDAVMQEYLKPKDVDLKIINRK